MQRTNMRVVMVWGSEGRSTIKINEAEADKDGALCSRRNIQRHVIVYQLSRHRCSCKMPETASRVTCKKIQTPFVTVNGRNHRRLHLDDCQRFPQCLTASTTHAPSRVKRFLEKGKLACLKPLRDADIDRKTQQKESGSDQEMCVPTEAQNPEYQRPQVMDV